MAHRRSPQADADLDNIWYYVATESGSADTAERFVQTIANRFYLLSRNPFLGRSRDDLLAGLRSFSIGDYLIFYRLENEDVVILRVLHGGRDMERIFGHEGN